MISNANKPSIHLWVYNHPLVGISDQIEFFFMIMQQHGYPVSMSRKPRLDALNVVIENFSEESSEQLIEFCKQTGKRVAVIMTEHLDLLDGELFFHGERLDVPNDYMHPATQMARVKNLMDCVTYLRSILVLGDLPQLKGSERMFPGLPCRSLPFPKLQKVAPGDIFPTNDLAFSGALTEFRKKVLRSLKHRCTVNYPNHFLSRRARDKLNESARIILNIPQRPGWRWLSLMRVIAGLRCGRATVSVNTVDESQISRCCLQLPREEFDARIEELIANWQPTYTEMFERYEEMRTDFLTEHAFPTDIFSYWALLERKSLKTPEKVVDHAFSTSYTVTEPAAV